MRWFGKLLMCFAIEFEYLQQRIIDFLRERIPGLSNELLPEWEEDLGLPEPCLESGTTVAERAAIAHAKYTANYSGQSKQFYIDYADKLGATITVNEYGGGVSVFRVDKNRVDRMPVVGIDGARLRSIVSKFKWIINIYNLTDVSLDNLKCIFEQLKPAHTTIIWVDYT